MSSFLNAASVIVGFVLLFSCVAAIVFITRLGRKVKDEAMPGPKNGGVTGRP